MKAWLTRPLPCKFGLHKLTDHNWGYGFGQLDLFCARCQKRVVSLAIGRLPQPADQDGKS